MLEGLVVRTAGVDPDPANETARVATLLTIDKLPLAFPADCGAKTTLKLAL
jgi:hypothetical protein